jgi:hypothetical protein
MNSIVQRIPNFVEIMDDKPKHSEFETLEELQAIPFVKQYISEPGFNGFVQHRLWLMAILEEGKKWLVVGRLRKPVSGLPMWREGKLP